MKNKVIIISLLLCVINVTTTLSQNLVINPGFEINHSDFLKPKDCKYTSNPSFFNKTTKGWNTFNRYTPDIILRPASLEKCIYPTPKSGQRMLGLILYHPAEDLDYERDYHEIVQGTLKSPLIPGKTYQISLWIYHDNQIAIDHLKSVYNRKTPVYPVSCNNLGFLFSELRADEAEDIDQSIEFFELKPQVFFKEILTTPAGEWKQYQLTFTPQKAYKYFLLGNFFLDDNTEISPNDFFTKYPQANSEEKMAFWKRPKRIAYYCFDDINISLLNEYNKTMASKLSNAGNYTFKSLNFESGQSKIPTAAYPELDALVNWLKSRPGKKIEIAGYTDNIGSAADNQILSENRVVSVNKYLVKKGISTKRISFTGYGESTPIADNHTAKGRRKNRRVEIHITD